MQLRELPGKCYYVKDLRCTMLNEFPRLTTRLSFIELCSDQLKNIDVYICLSEFENYVYGVVSQYKRITENQQKSSNERLSISLTQLRLDIYFYTLAWDKLRKVFLKLKEQLNIIFKLNTSLPDGFKKDFKQLRKRMEHLLDEFHITTRNEYEHPTLNPTKIGNLVGFGNLMSDPQGNIKIHVGQEEYAVVRKEHIERLNSLWVELIDIFVKYFTDKAPSSKLLLLKKQIEEDIDEIISEYENFKAENNDEEANKILHQLLMCELYLSKEQIPLRKDVSNKIFSVFAPGTISQVNH